MNFKQLFLAALLLVSVLPHSLLAQEYLVGIPGVADPGLSFGSYINALYALAISIGALMAVIKIIIAGMKWMLSDVVTSKQEAISDIRGSVLGLLVVISAVVVLNQINPQLTTTNIFIDPVNITPSTPVVVPAGEAPILRMGYRYVVVGEGTAAFEAACQEAQGALGLGSLDGESYNVCYDKISAAHEAWLSTTFPGLDIQDLRNRFQKYHFPRERANAGIRQETLPSGTSVVYAVSVENPGDWIDREQSSKMSDTCYSFQQALGVPVRLHRSVESEYLACIKNN